MSNEVNINIEEKIKKVYEIADCVHHNAVAMAFEKEPNAAYFDWAELMVNQCKKLINILDNGENSKDKGDLRDIEVRVEETYSKTFNIVAHDEEEAEEIVKSLMADGSISVLDGFLKSGEPGYIPEPSTRQMSVGDEDSWHEFWI